MRAMRWRAPAWWRAVAAAGAAAVLLAGCASVPGQSLGAAWPWPASPRIGVTPAERDALEQARDCCASLRELPFRELQPGARIDVSIGTDSPVHEFAQGRSLFAAYALRGLQGPAYLELRSLRAAQPGSALQRLLPDTRAAVLQPTLLLLDREFRPVRAIEAAQALPGCATSWAAPAYRISVLIDDPAQAAYLVVLSSRASRERKEQQVCGMLRDGMSAVGELDLRVRSLPAGLARPRLALPVVWHAGAAGEHEVGLWRGFVAEPGLLVAGESGLHMLEPTGSSYRAVADVAYADLLRTLPGSLRDGQLNSLSLAWLQRDPSATPRLQRATLQAVDEAGDGPADLDQLQDWLAARQRAGVATQTLAWSLSPQAPELRVEGSALSRIGQAAALGGMVTAMPCGLCQTGACPPEVLVSCAGLFGVGALLGATGGVVREAFAGPLPHERERGDITRAPPRLAHPSDLAQCLRQRIAAGDADWSQGGLQARSVLQGASAPVRGQGAVAGADLGVGYHVEVELLELTLVQPPPREAAALWRLRVDARLRLRDAASGAQRTRELSWVGDGHALADWAAADGAVPRAEAAKACAGLAGQSIDAARELWSSG